MSRKPQTASDIGRRGGKKAWENIAAEERSRILRERARKAWATRRAKNSP